MHIYMRRRRVWRGAYRVGRDDAVLVGIGLDDFELDGAHAAAAEEEVVLAHGAVAARSRQAHSVGALGRRGWGTGRQLLRGR